jgi:hypothetical protein
MFALFRLAGKVMLVKAAFLVSMFAPPALPTLWFMTMICLFYVLAPLLAIWSGSARAIIPLTTILWVDIFLFSLDIHKIDTRLLIYLPTFVMGLFLSRTKQKPSLTPWVLAAIISGLISIRAGSDLADRSLWMMPWALSSAAAVFLISNQRLPYSRFISLMCEASFFLYLFHRVVFKVFLATGPMSPPLRTGGLILIALPIAILVGLFGQRVYDRLIDRLLQTREQTARVGALATANLRD